MPLNLLKSVIITFDLNFLIFQAVRDLKIIRSFANKEIKPLSSAYFHLFNKLSTTLCWSIFPILDCCNLRELYHMELKKGRNLVDSDPCVQIIDSYI